MVICIGSIIKKKKFGKKPQEREVRKQQILPEGVRGIVRFVESDIDGTKKVGMALTKIKGVGINFANNVAKLADIDPTLLLGTLSEEQLKKMEDIIKNPLKYGFPKFILNRQQDVETGETRHVLASELVITRKADIDRMKKIHSYKGVRHELGLPVRGQRTRGSFRKGTTAGVSKVKLKPGKKSAPKSAPAKKPAKK
jgi:small subunit ribosomal protein S13